MVVYFVPFVVGTRKRAQKSSAATSTTSVSPLTSVLPVSGGAATTACAAPLAGQSGSATSTSPAPSAVGIGDQQSRDQVLLRKVEELVSGSSVEVPMKDAFLNFLRASLPAIDEAVFPQYFGTITSYTEKCIELSREVWHARAQANQAAPQHPQPSTSGEAAQGIPSSTGHPSSGDGQQVASGGLTGELVDPQISLPDPTMPRIIQVDSVHRGPSGMITGRQEVFRQTMAPPVVSTTQNVVPGGMMGSPRAGTSTGHGSGAGSWSIYDPQRSPNKFNQPFKPWEGQPPNPCTALNSTSASPTVTTVSSEGQTRSYTNLQTVSLNGLSATSAKGFVQVHVPSSVAGGEAGQGYPSFGSIPLLPTYPLVIRPEPLTLQELHTPNPERQLYDDDMV